MNRSLREKSSFFPGSGCASRFIPFADGSCRDAYQGHFKKLVPVYNLSDYLIRISDGQRVTPDFNYCSDTNREWMTKEQLHNWIDKNREIIGLV